MNIVAIIKQTFDIIVSPNNAWEKLAVDSDNTTKKDYYYFYTLLVINILSAFIGGLFEGEKINFVAAFLRAILWGTALYASFWAIYFLLTEFLYKRNNLTIAKQTSIRLINYSFALVLSINCITYLFPDLFFIKIALIYTLFIVWEGVGKMISVLNENERSNFVLFLSGSIILIPIIFYQFFILAFPAAR
ncbi:MAG: hypothetical protein JXQ69_08805 [Paludibacteraceae bacterium]|nr:hypothetical protein [Paludibacteraceae bacterium]MBN2788403.1 hypothetical protein [Paludibacteraceae bacterium]